ncbi:methyltransferase domain-containing protein [Lysobacter firmicutimachus]|uniref:Methyltransferase domain-containing protein n=1 Tax=Lysobacter firmicutimachus TaxID=1792846 RepID=A0AAU8MPV6_9GAMM|nr:methyltransferase domain-containing protein [Lysobacter antibioticus]
MPFCTRLIDVPIGDVVYRIRALKDRQQFHDPDRTAERAGVPAALWSLFGQLWPAGIELARESLSYRIDGKRILEIGCGLGLSSLVLKKRGADITASDHHPLANEFLAHNARLNGLKPIPFNDLAWERPQDSSMGKFDLIVGSDVLYERGHIGSLLNLIRNYATAEAEVLISDPGRGNCASFAASMLTAGFTLSSRGYDIPLERRRNAGRMMRFER